MPLDSLTTIAPIQDGRWIPNSGGFASTSIPRPVSSPAKLRARRSSFSEVDHTVISTKTLTPFTPPRQRPFRRAKSCILTPVRTLSFLAFDDERKELAMIREAAAALHADRLKQLQDAALCLDEQPDAPAMPPTRATPPAPPAPLVAPTANDATTKSPLVRSGTQAKLPLAPLDPNLIRPATSGTSLRRPSTSAALVATRFAKLPQLEFVDRNDLNSFSASGIDRLKSHWSTTLEEDGVYFSSHESLMSAVFGLAPLAAALRKRGSSGALTGVAYVPPDCSHEVASEHCCVVHLGANFARVSRGAGKMRTVSNALVFHFAPRADTPVSGG